jgi:hypothetical protein
MMVPQEIGNIVVRICIALRVLGPLEEHKTATLAHSRYFMELNCVKPVWVNSACCIIREQVQFSLILRQMLPKYPEKHYTGFIYRIL